MRKMTDITATEVDERLKNWEKEAAKKIKSILSEEEFQKLMDSTLFPYPVIDQK